MNTYFQIARNFLNVNAVYGGHDEARLARESVAPVCQKVRVIDLRGRASLQQNPFVQTGKGGSAAHRRLTLFVNAYRVWFLLALLLTPATGFAMICKTQGTGETVIRGNLDSSVAIPASAPDGEIVWRSERQDLQVECI
jgi:hypothetical protein